jgi:hypothetical protein
MANLNPVSKAPEIKAAPVSDKKTVNVKYLRDKDAEKVKGIFRFHEVPGGEMRFVYKAYKGEEVERYELQDGKIYTLPLGVARHLNKNCWYPAYEYFKGEDVHTTHRVSAKVKRCSFQSLEFMDLEDLSSDLVTVTAIPNSAF